MATFSKLTLSGSTDGRGILVTPTATAGETIHTGSATATTFDEIWIYAYNSHTVAVDLTLEWGGVASPDDLIRQTMPLAGGGVYAGPIPIIEGWILKGNATPLVVKAFASVADKVVLFGYVNRIAA
jgi:hypothetical protein